MTRVMEVVPGLINKLCIGHSVNREGNRDFLSTKNVSLDLTDYEEHSFACEEQVVIGEDRQAILYALIELAQKGTYLPLHRVNNCTKITYRHST